MKKPVKYLGLALGGVVALVVAGIVVFALTFDPNRYKDEIERMAMERTGRTLLRIGGSGDIDIGRSTISYVAKASIVAGLTVPVKLAGPLDAMKYEVDYRAVAGDLVKSK